jgi:hypothetical protein
MAECRAVTERASVQSVKVTAEHHRQVHLHKGRRFWELYGMQRKGSHLRVSLRRRKVLIPSECRREIELFSYSRERALSKSLIFQI